MTTKNRSVFWHTGLRNPLLSNANFVAYDLLRLGKGSWLGRYTSTYLTFALSGFIHTLVDNTAGIPMAGNTAYKLFIMQAVGIMVEDLAGVAYHKVAGPSTPGLTRLWKKAVGFLWVLGWLTWTTPPWSYQNMRHNADPLWPVSMIDTFKALTA